MNPLQRRTVLKAMVLAGGGMAVHPALASTLGGLAGTTGASRKSRLDRSGALTLVHTDLHNHSFISGDAEATRTARCTTFGRRGSTWRA